MVRFRSANLLNTIKRNLIIVTFRSIALKVRSRSKSNLSFKNGDVLSDDDISEEVNTFMFTVSRSCRLIFTPATLLLHFLLTLFTAVLIVY